MAAPDTPRPRLTHAAPALLLLLTALATATACHHLRPRHATFPWDSLQLLQAMAPSPAQPCHHQHAPSFPDTLLNTPRSQQPAAALSILHHLLQILSSNSIPQHWHKQTQEQLLNSLHQFIHHLEQCLPPNKMLSRTQGPRNLLLTIHKYFRDIHDFLRTHNHSACAWDHVRLQARICFQYMDQQLGQVKSQTAPAIHQTRRRPMPIASQHQRLQTEQSPQQHGLGSLSTAPTAPRQETTATRV